MELAVLTLFAVLLIGALAAGVPILYALIDVYKRQGQLQENDG